MAFNAEFKGGRVMQWIHDKQMANRYGKIASLQYVILYRTPTLLFLLFLFPVLVQATESVYEQQIQQARNVITRRFSIIFSVISSSMP
jgi:hypothetical protein